MTQHITVNGNTYSDDGSVGAGMDDGGFRENLIPMLGDTIVDAAGKVAAAANQAEIAKAQADMAIGAAASTVTGPGSTGTSTTSLLVGMGTKNLTIQTGKTLYPGMPITIAASATPRDAMYGTLMSYNPATGALVVYVDNLRATTAGVYITANNWTISLSGPAAVTGVLNEFKGGNIASAATIDVNPVTGNYFHLTGSTGPVTAVTLAQGAERTITLDGAPTFVNSSTLILPTAANVVGEVGDVVTFRGEGGGVTKVTNWERASGKALAAVSPGLVKIAGPITPSEAATLDFLNIFGDAFLGYQISATGIMPTVAQDQLCVRLANAGVVDTSTSYGIAQSAGGGGVGGTAVSFSSVQKGSRGCNVEIDLKNLSSAGGLKSIDIRSISEPSNPGSLQFYDVMGVYIGPAASGIRFFWTLGNNFAPTGEIYIYGISKL